MPSAFAHAAVGASLAAGLPRRRRLVVAVALAVLAAAPDLDVMGLWLGIPYAHPLGHRGLTHSLFFAAVVGLASFPLWRRAGLERPRHAAALVFLALASHGLLDTFTDAGLGVGLLIPLDDERYFAPFRPLLTSPLSIWGFFSPRGLEIVGNELLWIGPLVVASTVGAIGARAAARRSAG